MQPSADLAASAYEEAAPSLAVTERDGDRLPGCLVLMCGPPCSGKTTSARALAEELHAVRLAPDEWIASLGLDLRTPLRDNVDLLQWVVAQEIVRRGGTVIIESGHWMKSERDERRLWARAVGARVELRYLDLPVEVLLARARQRTSDDGWATYPLTDDELLGWLSYFEPPTEAEQWLFDAAESPT